MNHHKLSRRLLAMALSLIMVLGMMPVSAAAENLNAGISGEIVSFQPLSEVTAAQRVALGTPLGNLNLPESLTATVRLAVYTDERVQDSGNALQQESAQNTESVQEDLVATGETVAQPADEGIQQEQIPKEEVSPEDKATPSVADQETTDPVQEETTDEGMQKKQATKGEVSTEDEEAPVGGQEAVDPLQEESDTGYTETTASVPVKWTATPDYDGNTAGIYVFTAETEGFTLSAETPAITVTVQGEAVKGTITAFDELTEDIRWQNTHEPVFPEMLTGTVEGQIAQIPVTWEADHNYDSDSPANGLYVFAAKPGEGYAIAEDTEAPRITVYIPAVKRMILRMGGGGTSASPLEITTAAQLLEIAVLVNAGRLETFLFNDSSATVSLKLMNDIDLSAYGKDWNGGKGWKPIGTETNSFKGIFDGNDNKITGLFINRTENITGLFGRLAGGTVENLKLVEVSISGAAQVGGIAGYIECSQDGLVGGRVTNCDVSGSISGTGGVGGVAGYVIGGITDLVDSRVINSSVSGSVSGSNVVGGVAGSVGGNVTNCYVTGLVSGAGVVGGVAGIVHGGVANCYAASAVTGKGDQVGGVAGKVNSGSVTNCYATGTVTCKGTGNNVGGVAGYVATDGVVTNCYTISTINATGLYIGGVAGFAYGNVTNCAGLNPSVSGTGTVGRVAGAFANGTLSGNAAFSGMAVKVNNIDQPISGGTSNNINGADISSADITTGSYWATSINWNNPTVWTVEIGKMPILAAIPADVQDAAIPPHLVLGGSSSYFLGEGTSTAPYQISTAEQLAKLAELVNAGDTSYNNKHYKLTADLDLSAYGEDWNSGKGWMPIGSTSTFPFKGAFDGGSKKITGLFINRTEELTGLFGFVTGTVENLKLMEVSITGGDCVGSVAGYVYGANSDVANCSVSGSISGAGGVGGVVGYTYYGIVINCNAYGLVSGAKSVGGVAGSVFGTDSGVVNCYATSTVTGKGDSAGGVAGRVNSGIVTNSYATGTVTGTGSHIGGVAGYVALNGDVINCYATGAVISNGAGSNFGGVAGITYGNVTNCAALNPSVTGSSEVGRVAGAIAGGGTLTGNAAFSGMTDLGTGKFGSIVNSPADKNGVDISTAEIKADGTIYGRFATAGGWTTENGKLPILINAGGTQDAALPPHLAGGSSNHFLGEGTSGAPYQIGTADQLAKLAELVNDSATNATYGGKDIYYKLIADLDLSAYGKDWNSGKGWVPIGSTGSTPFKGIFDGGNKKITGLSIINRTEQFSGLFGYMSGGTIQNLGIEEASISGSGSVGGVAGYVNGGSSITYCYVIGSVTGHGTGVGGIVGSVDGFVDEENKVANCYATASVTGSNNIGGIAGSVLRGWLTDCYSTGSVIGKGNSVGGVAGCVLGGVTTNCYATGVVGGTSDIGGVAGAVSNNSIVRNCAALNPSVSGSSNVGRVAGFVGTGVTLSGSVAFSGMTGAGNPDGTNVSSRQMNTASFWATAGNWDTSGWDTSVWTIQDGKLPVLQNVGGTQSGESGLYLILRDIAGAAVTLNEDTYTYTGASITPSLTVTFDGQTLEKDVDYQVSVAGGSASNGINVGTVTMNLTGTGNFTGTKTGITFNIEKASQSAPAAPTLSSKNAIEVMLNAISGAEYRKGTDGAWQDSFAFTALAPNTAYSFYARLKGDTNHEPSPASEALLVTTDKPMLIGGVTINGTAEYGNTLIANVLGLSASSGYAGYDLGTLRYQWNRNGVPISVTPTNNYILMQEDLGARITVTVTAENCSGSVTSAPTAAVEKADGPEAPTGVTGSYTGDGSAFTYTISSIPGAEYRMDSGAWQNSNVFAGIAPASTPTFYTRIKETATHKAGAAGNTGAVTFEKLNDRAAPALNYTVSESDFPKTITITAVPGTEYKFGSASWGSIRTYTSNSAENVTLYIRWKATATHIASPEASVIVDTANQNQSAPPAFTLTYASVYDTSYTVTIPATAGAEYSFDGTNWSVTNTRTGCQPGDTITGYKRMAAKPGYNASSGTSSSLTLSLFQVKTPTALPNGGTFTGSQSVTLSCTTAGADIYYTTDGSLPTAGSTLYIGAFTLNATATVKAIGVKPGMTDSRVLSVTFTKETDRGGNNGGGGGSSSGTTTTPEMKTDQPVTADASVTAEAGTNGAANATIPNQTITDSIAKAQADAKSQGKAANNICISVTLDNPANTRSIGIVLTQPVLKQFTDAKVQQFEVNGQLLTLNLNQTALQEIQNQSTGDVTITVKPVSFSGVRRAYSITISTVRDGKTVNLTSLGNGSVTLSIPYTPGNNEAAGCLYAVYVDGNGKVNRIPGSAYDANSQRIIFTTNHFSVYGVGYTAPSAKFTDTDAHWGKESIDYVVGRGLLSGTSETAFAPDNAMTRGMLVTALGRLSGVDTKVYNTSSFPDVEAESAYHPYIEWAYQNGIIQGVGNQQFAPDRDITREEIAVIFANYANATGYILPVTRKAVTFADAVNIGSSYSGAVRSMQQAGIMMGEQNNKFNPKANATRAEVSSMLYRYIKLTITPATAQGWALDDDGQYLCYKDGKALTGTQTIDGVKYYFNTDGTLKTGWVKDGDNWRFYSGKTMLVGFWDLGSNGNNKTYYFTKCGVMVSGKWLEIDGKWYYFYADGSLARSIIVDGYEVDENGVRKTR